MQKSVSLSLWIRSINQDQFQETGLRIPFPLTEKMTALTVRPSESEESRSGL